MRNSICVFLTLFILGSEYCLNANSQTLITAPFNELEKNHSAVLPDPKVESVTTVYQSCNLGGEGFAVSLVPGEYTLMILEKKKILDNQISSLSVKKGYEVELFEFDNFQGKSMIFTSDDICLIDNRVNDWATSIKVREVVSK